MPASISNIQPSLVLNPVIATGGIFPMRDGGSGYVSNILGQVHFLATNYTGNSQVAQAEGGLFAIAQNTALFSLLGTMYGGNGVNTFGVPDFMGHANISAGQGPGLTDHYFGDVFGTDSVTLISSEMPIGFGGSSQPIDNQQSTQTIGWYINAAGIYPTSGAANMIGGVSAFAGNFAPNGAIPCDGRLLAIAEYDTLFSVIGTTYGGDGQTTFAVPDLRGRSIIGAGAGPDGHTYVVGEVVGSETLTIGNSAMPGGVGGGGGSLDNRGPGLVLQPLIALQGIFGGFDEMDLTLGEVYFFAGTNVPNGMATAQGQLMPINQNQALFSLLGTQFGGNGQTTFALPNLSGRTVIGDGNGYALGETYGGTVFNVAFEALPDLTIVGNIGNETMAGANGNDSLSGGDGNDGLRGNNGNDSLSAGNGRDTLTGGNGDDALDGGNGVDRATYETAAAGVTIDLQLAGAQNTGGGGIDTLIGIENLLGSNFTDSLTGNAGRNWLSGNGGDDALAGGGGNDTLLGGSGNDTLTGGDGNDSLNGGSGTDLADYSGAASAVNVDLRIKVAQNTGGAGFDALHQIENLTGSAFDDLLSGNLFANTLRGGDGSDTLYGQGGDDVLYGENGADQLTGGAGNDELHGGAGDDTLGGGIGADRYVFDLGAATGGHDNINGFTPGEDVIVLSVAAFPALADLGVGALDPGELIFGTAASSATDRLIYDAATGTLYYDSDGVGGVDAYAIVTLNNLAALTAGDIILI